MYLDAIVTEYLRSTSDEDSREENVLEICQAITLKQHTLLDLVSTLGEYLTENDSTIRSRSMQLLQRVIGGIPQDTLSGQHITVVVQFFCDRLSDDVCLSESLSALVSISNMSRFAEADAQLTATSVLGITEDIQQRPQRLRYQIYILLDGMMARKRNALKHLGKSFLTGFTSLVNGEKDPRNLMVAFSVMKVILQEFDIVSLVADLFDVVYCYFPITFRPPPDDPTSITTDDLKERLRNCLSATHQFAPYLIPALLEKLNAVAVSVKKDTLLTLISCCKTYSARTIDPYTSQLWAALKFEVIQAEDNFLEQIALNLITGVTTCLARGLTDMPRQGSLSRWLQPIVTEALEELKEPELKSAKSCGKIIRSVAVASNACLQVVAKSILPGLLAICDEAKQSNRLASLLEVLGCLLDAAQIASTAEDAESTSCLSFTKKELVEQISKRLHALHLEDLELTKAALFCALKLFQIKYLLDDIERREIIHRVDYLLVEGGTEVADEALSTLASLSVIKPDLILECTFPVLLAKLPSDNSEDIRGCDKNTIRKVLNNLARLSEQKIVFDTLIVRLFSRLDSTTPTDVEEVWYSSQLLSTVRNVLQHYSDDPNSNPAVFYTKVVPHIFSWAITQCGTISSTPETLSTSAEIVNLICRRCDTEQQRALTADLFSLFLTGGMNNLIRHVDPEFRPFAATSKSMHQLDTLALFLGAYSGLRQDLDIVTTLRMEFLDTVVRLSLDCENAFQKLSLLRIICLMINKCRSDADLTTGVTYMSSALELTNVNNRDVLLWTCKALVLRSHRQSQALIRLIIKNLDDEHHGLESARSFQILIGDDPYLSNDNHCVIKRLHKQKFYAIVVPELMQKLENASSGKHHSNAASKEYANVPSLQDKLSCRPINDHRKCATSCSSLRYRESDANSLAKYSAR